MYRLARLLLFLLLAVHRYRRANPCPLWFLPRGSKWHFPRGPFQILTITSSSTVRHATPSRMRRFRCPYHPCTREFATRNDLERHLATPQHRNDVEDWEERANRYKCPATACKFGENGFARKDHYKRHMRTMHPSLALNDDYSAA